MLTFLVPCGVERFTLNDLTVLFYPLSSVAPLPSQTHQVVASLPSLARSPFQPTDDMLVAFIGMVTALALTASVGLTLVLG